MFSEKIDARLFEKISIQSAENTEMSVVIMLSNVNKISQQFNMNYINIFPSLNCIVAKLKRKEKPQTKLNLMLKANIPTIKTKIS